MTIERRVCPKGCGPLESYASTPIGDFGPWGCPICHYIEQPTSNLVVRLRNYGSRYAHPVCHEAADAIENLTAELGEYKSRAELAEIAQVESSRRYGSPAALEAERDRLRAELEQARSATFGLKDDLEKLHEVAAIIEWALAGAPDEPAADHPTDCDKTC